jgi:hypothetical protein
MVFFFITLAATLLIILIFSPDIISGNMHVAAIDLKKKIKKFKTISGNYGVAANAMSLAATPTLFSTFFPAKKYV